MKRSKRLLILAGCLVIACAATFILTNYEEKQEQIRMTDEIVLSVPAETVSGLSWEYEDSSLAFRKQDGQWFYEEDEAFPVSDQKIDTITSRFAGFGAAFIIEDVEDYGQYGLNDPVCTLSLETAEKNYQIRMGDFSKMDEQRYVDVGDGNVYLVSSDPCLLLPEELSGMIRHDTVPAILSADRLVLSGTDNETILRLEDSGESYCEEDIWYIQRDGKNLPLDSDLVQNYLDSFSYLSLSDYVTYNASEEDLKEYGLDDPIQSITVNCTTYGEDGEEPQPESCTVHIGMNPEELAAAIEAEEAGEEVPDVVKYARVGNSKIVYRLSELDFEYVMAVSYDHLRHQEVFWGDLLSVTSLEVTLESQTHTIHAATEEDEETGELTQLWQYKDTPVEGDALSTALTSLTAVEFTDAPASDKEEIALTLHLDNENFPQVHLQFYRHDGSTCLAVVDGESVSLVDRSAVVDLMEAVRSIVLNG